MTEAKKQGIQPSELAGFVGFKATYMVDRKVASSFSELYGGPDLAQYSMNKPILTELTCKACGFHFKGKELKSRLKEHMKKTHPYFTDQCTTCGENLTSWDQYVEHSRDVHGGMMKWLCNRCDATFTARGDLKNHKVHDHKKSSAQSVCSFCGKQFQSSYIKEHMLSAHGEEYVTCLPCKRSFRHPIALKSHMKKAHGTVSCNECGKVCNSMRYLKHHIRSQHTPDALKPFRCSKCSKGFVEKSRLEDHMNIHLGLKPYSCEKCPLSFSNTSNRVAHIKSVHMGLKRSSISRTTTNN
jgi:KRAB domain-containing zinc finger protein